MDLTLLMIKPAVNVSVKVVRLCLGMDVKCGLFSGEKPCLLAADLTLYFDILTDILAEFLCLQHHSLACSNVRLRKIQISRCVLLSGL